MVLLSVVLLVASMAINKIYQRITDSSLRSGAVFGMCSAIFSFALFFIINGCTIKLSLYSVLNSLLKSLCGSVYALIGYKIIAEGGLAPYMLFLMSGGMAVPAVLGWIFLGEPFSFLRLFGVITIIAGIAVSNSDIKKMNKKLLLMCTVVFVLNGFVSLLSKLHQTNTEWNAVGTTDYVLIGCICGFIINMVTRLFMGQKKETEAESAVGKEKKLGSIFKLLLPFLVILLYSAVGNVSSFLQLEGAKNLPASVLYPLITGGSIVLSGVCDFLFFEEKPNVGQWIGMLVCFVGTCMFL